MHPPGGEATLLQLCNPYFHRKYKSKSILGTKKALMFYAPPGREAAVRRLCRCKLFGGLEQRRPGRLPVVRAVGGVRYGPSGGFGDGHGVQDARGVVGSEPLWIIHREQVPMGWIF